MTKKTKKLAVFAALRTQAAPIALSELLQILGSDFTERSTRRWLGELINEGLVKKTGHKKGTRYQILVPSVRQSLLGFFDIWKLKAIDYIRQPIFQRKPVGYNRQWLTAATFYKLCGRGFAGN